MNICVALAVDETARTCFNALPNGGFLRPTLPACVPIAQYHAKDFSLVKTTIQIASQRIEATTAGWVCLEDRFIKGLGYLYLELNQAPFQPLISDWHKVAKEQELASVPVINQQNGNPPRIALAEGFKAEELDMVYSHFERVISGKTIPWPLNFNRLLIQYERQIIVTPLTIHQSQQQVGA